MFSCDLKHIESQMSDVVNCNMRIAIKADLYKRFGLNMVGIVVRMITKYCFCW